MNMIKDGATGFVGCILMTATEFFENLPTWVSAICAAIIAIVTCLLQARSLILDKKERKQRKEVEEKTQKGEEEK